MANICDQRVVIAARSEEDMVEVLEMMADNVIDGLPGDDYFTRDELGAARGDMRALEGLLERCNGTMNKLCLFSKKPDSRTESGWLHMQRPVGKGKPIILVVDIGVKWSASDDPYSFCAALDNKRFGTSVSAGGEAYEWETFEIDGDYYELNEIGGLLEEADGKLARARSLQKIARYTNILGAGLEIYLDIAGE